MRTGRDDEKISLPFNIDKPWMKRAVFLDFSAHLLITAFANSHLKVLRQCNAVIIRAFEISKASQVSYMAKGECCVKSGRKATEIAAFKNSRCRKEHREQ